MVVWGDELESHVGVTNLCAVGIQDFFIHNLVFWDDSLKFHLSEPSKPGRTILLVSSVEPRLPSHYISGVKSFTKKSGNCCYSISPTLTQKYLLMPTSAVPQPFLLLIAANLALAEFLG